MFQTKTVFIVGAGASCEVGLPSGHDLKRRIVELTNIKFEDGVRQSSGDWALVQAFRDYLKQENKGRDINQYVGASRLISNAMAQAISIDHFIDAHRTNPHITLAGKLSIARSILSAEKRSQLFDSASQSHRVSFDTLSSSWYSWFFQMLTETLPRESVSSIFENISFICFNYDRCIEQFLLLAIQRYYNFTQVEAIEILKTLKIVHPYGTVGSLPWQQPNGAIHFGQDVTESALLLKIASQIKTFTEKHDDETAVAEMGKLVADAETIIFLGFAFHPQNMTLIQPTRMTHTSRVFATAHGISTYDADALKNEIASWLNGSIQNYNVHVRNDLKCVDLFREYWRALPRS